MSLKCKEKCFPGICQWGYLKKMLTAPCCFFAPCKERECLRIFQREEGSCDFCSICLFSYLGELLCITNVIIYYIGLAFYAIFWLIGKFFVYISCSDDCWLNEDYDMDTLRFTRTLNAQPDIHEGEEDN